MFDERREVLEKTRHIVEFQTEADVYPAGVFILQGPNGVAVALIVVDRKSVWEWQWTVATETEGGKAMGESKFHIFAGLAFAVAKAAVSVIVGQWMIVVMVRTDKRR